jgi:glycosyltransferase involved in cell wall biosynthesis
MQEADAMWRLGVPVIIASNTGNADKLRAAYRDLETIHRHVRPYSGPAELGSLIDEVAPTAIVATTNQSVHTMASAFQQRKGREQPRAAYYIQDYEPLFYERDSNDWVTAYSSYGLISGMIHFAKTNWLQETVERNHPVKVHKVEPSIDHKVYYPDIPFVLRERKQVVVAAMLRPATPRRAPRRTLRILNRIAHEMQSTVTCVTFGCSTAELEEHSLRLNGVSHLGPLKRDEVGELFRNTDLFLDLSDFQAFGRTAIEAMSCGAVSVVPAHGGAYEFAKDCKNSFIVDTRSDDDILRAVRLYLNMPDAERSVMSLAAIGAGFRYTPEQAALSELSLLLN